ncbi:MAG: hypothetical protein H7Z75_01615 [Ferruginibacter sp.]|nr:hypothetical protein [Cytophagales bacterium]
MEKRPAGRVLYSSRFLCVGACCPDSPGRRGIRVSDLRRDFTYGQFDQFSAFFDPFRDQRNAVISA